jgi:hypothetical protein
LEFPYGLVEFDIINIAPGSTVTVTLTLPAPVTSLWKLQFSQWIEQTQAQFSGNQVTYKITDGTPGDEDLTDNGWIEDPTGPAVAQVPAAVVVTPTFTG